MHLFEPFDIVDEVVRARRAARSSSWQPITISPFPEILVPRLWMKKTGYIREELASLPSPQLIALAEDALWRDLELVSDIWWTLHESRRARGLRRLNRMLAMNGVRRIPWLDAAREAVRSLTPVATGAHRVYTILLGGYGGAQTDYGIYVGETSTLPEVRLMQHLTGARSQRGTRLAASSVRRRGIELLPTVSAPFGQIDWQEAKNAERLVADALRGIGLQVEGGH